MNASAEPFHALEKDPSAERRNFAMLSHDIRNAVSGILGGLSQIDPDRLPAEVLPHLERVKASAELLSGLVQHALDGRDLPGGDTDRERTALADLLRSLRQRWVAQAGDKGLAFRIETAPGLPDALALDPVLLQRILSNLIGNAIKFTDGGGVVLRVFRRQDGAFCLTVRDDGPGFSAEALARIFAFGGRPADSGKPGSGLGLYIAKSFADSIKADLDIANRPEGGAEVTLCLPAALCIDPLPDQDPAGAEGARPGSPTGRLDGVAVLLAEDNVTNQMVATQMLESLGAEVIVASDGVEALDLFESRDVDLCLLDIEMPRLSGLDVMRRIRGRTDARARTPLLALTAYALREHRDRIAAAGADGVISKPITSIDAFGRAILGFLDRPRDAAVVRSAPSPAQPDAGAATIDRAVYDALVAAIGADTMGELLEKVQADLASVEEGLIEGLSSGDRAKLRAKSHILISVAGAVGALGLMGAAERLNAAAHGTGSVDVLAEAVAECVSGIRDVSDFVRHEQAG